MLDALPLPWLLGQELVHHPDRACHDVAIGGAPLHHRITSLLDPRGRFGLLQPDRLEASGEVRRAKLIDWAFAERGEDARL